MNTSSKFIDFNGLDVQLHDENGYLKNGAYFDANDYDKGIKTILRFRDGKLDGDIYSKDGKFVMAKPAVEGPGHMEYWRDGKLHRDNDEPAVISNGFCDREWWKDGVFIRDEKSASQEQSVQKEKNKENKRDYPSRS